MHFKTKKKIAFLLKRSADIERLFKWW